MAIILLILTFLILVAVEVAYIPIAKANRWTTERNLRADGHPVTVIGGGIIFYIAMVIWSLTLGWVYDIQEIGSNFIVGLTMLAACSFADDLLQLKVWIRLVVQFIAALFLCFQFNLFGCQAWMWSLYIVCLLGFVNGYNFMDGINGMTAAYSLVTLTTFLYIDLCVIHFTSGMMITMSLISVVIFTFLNFRRHAIVFAGDVGAISMGYIIAAILTDFLLDTHEISGLVLVAVYGVDTLLTIFRRLAGRENIFLPHRKHAYQYLCNVWRIGQLKVSTAYALTQAAISGIYLVLPDDKTVRLTYLVAVIALLVTVYIIIISLSERRMRRSANV